MSSNSLTDLGTADRDRLEALLVEFDQGWEPGRLSAAVERLPAAGALRTAGLRELVQIDRERHARLGRSVPLSDYLERFPGIVRSLTREQVTETARRWIDPHHLVTATAGPPRGG